MTEGQDSAILISVDHLAWTLSTKRIDVLTCVCHLNCLVKSAPRLRTPWLCSATTTPSRTKRTKLVSLLPSSLFLSRLATSNNCLLTYYWICFDSLQTFGIRRARSLSTNCTRLTTLGPTCALWYSMWRARWPTRICATGMLRWGISVPTFHASALQTRSICRNRLSIAGTSSLRRLIALSNLFQPPMERMLWQSSSKLLKLVYTTRKIPTKMTSWTIFWTYSTTRSQQDV